MMRSAAVRVLRAARADLRALTKDGFLRGSWLVAVCLLAVGLHTATAFTQFVVLAGTRLPDGFYTRQAVGLVVLTLNFPFVILGAVLGGGDFSRGTHQNRVVSSGRLGLGIARLIALAAACVVTMSVVVGVGTIIDIARPEVHPLDFASLLLLAGSVSMVAFLWGATALVIALLGRSLLVGLLLAWGMLATELLGTMTQATSRIVDLLPLHVGLSMLNALTSAPPEEIVNLHPPALLDLGGSLIAALIWIAGLVATYLTLMARQEC